MYSPIEILNESLEGRYKLSREVGRGGMAIVYMAKDLVKGSRVAIKVFDSARATPEARKRFLREIDLVSSINHPKIVPVIDAGEADRFLFFVMPFIEGRTLRQLLVAAHPPTVQLALRIARDAAGALAAAHANGIVHRDIKPENILVKDGVAFVADFGVAKALQNVGAEPLTQAGMTLGTPRYMSPEQAAGRVVDHRSDIYALGVVIWEAMTGDVPNRDEHDSEKGGDSMSQLPDPVADLLRRCIAAEPSARLESAEDLVQAIDEILPMLEERFAIEPVTGPGTRRVLAILGVVLIIAAFSLGLVVVR